MSTTARTTRKREVRPQSVIVLKGVQKDLENLLKRRQLIVMDELEEGASKAQVAKVLGINPHQVDTILNPKRRQV